MDLKRANEYGNDKLVELSDYLDNMVLVDEPIKFDTTELNLKVILIHLTVILENMFKDYVVASKFSVTKNSISSTTFFGLLFLKVPKIFLKVG